MLTLIVPILNEADRLPGLLEHLQGFRQRGCQVILVDGGSEDGSVALARQAGFDPLHCSPGRARQMNAGAAVSQGDVLLFLHADSRLPAAGDRLVLEAMAEPRVVWGRFDVRLEGRSWGLPMVAWAMNLRSRLSGICTGDQSIFVRRNAFLAVGGFPDQPLMEDIALSKALRRMAWPRCLRPRALSSGRRWDERGLWATIVLMWRLRLAYWLGADPRDLAERYR